MANSGLREIRIMETKTEQLLQMAEPERVQQVTQQGSLVATGECSLAWYVVEGVVWCVRSRTQCDYAGPLETWQKPRHAKCSCCNGKGYHYTGKDRVRTRADIRAQMLGARLMVIEAIKALAPDKRTPHMTNRQQEDCYRRVKVIRNKMESLDNALF